MLFPGAAVTGAATRIEIDLDDDGFPVVLWAGLSDGAGATAPSPGPVPVQENGPGIPLLGEHSRGLFTRPHLRGHRIADAPGAPAPGLSWSSKLVCESVEESVVDGRPRLTVRAADPVAGLAVTTEVEAVVGGALRMRHTLTNTAPGTYLLEGLEAVLPADDRYTETMDFTGRHERERSPQRRALTDGLWLRESRFGRPGLGAATMVVLGTPGFSTTYGEVLAVHVAWSGNSVLRVERDAGTGTTLGGGELLQPGEMGLVEGEAYSTPWVMFAAADDGLDGLAAVWHQHQRSLVTHPTEQPVVLNVWEAVYFDHDLGRLRTIADRAARVGVELFVLDDGWFRYRRDDTAGLGDWWVDPLVWPDGLGPLVDHVRSRGMSFGLWFEPEMVNPDSDLYREHPDWILAAGDRIPLLHRNQLVLDLSRKEVWDYLFERIDAALSDHPIEFVKWDHNRDLLDAGSSARLGAPVVHAQTHAFYALLDALRRKHPGVAWESCASGGGRVDLGVLEHVQRVWTSDMTDALARQEIQRWAVQLLAPEYVGAHVSSPTSHTTGRTLPLDFRAATALFGSFGIEWDLTQADDDDLDELAVWVERYKRFRGLLHSGRVTRPESSDPSVLLHGVVGDDEALMAHVQLDESVHNRGVSVRVPGLDPVASYRLSWEGPVMHRAVSKSSSLPAEGPTAGALVSGRTLANRGFWIPRRRPETVTLVHLTRA
jgi:alpha-galactosidase